MNKAEQELLINLHRSPETPKSLLAGPAPDPARFMVVIDRERLLGSTFKEAVEGLLMYGYLNASDFPGRYELTELGAQRAAQLAQNAPRRAPDRIEDLQSRLDWIASDKAFRESP